MREFSIPMPIPTRAAKASLVKWDGADFRPVEAGGFRIGGDGPLGGFEALRFIRIHAVGCRRMTRAETRRRRGSGPFSHRHRVNHRGSGSRVPTLPISCRSQRLCPSARDFCCMNAGNPARFPGRWRAMEGRTPAGVRAGMRSVAPPGAGCSWGERNPALTRWAIICRPSGPGAADWNAVPAQRGRSRSPGG
jgi:hypothetical protein